MQLQTREAVIAAADALFVERGFHASSVGDIAAAAGYTKGAVYSNFASKEDVFFAVYDRRAQRGVAEMERVLASDVGEGFDVLTRNAAQRRGTAEDGGEGALQSQDGHVRVQGLGEHHERAAVIAGDDAEDDRAFEVDDRAADLGAVFQLEPAHGLGRTVEP